MTTPSDKLTPTEQMLALKKSNKGVNVSTKPDEKEEKAPAPVNSGKSALMARFKLLEFASLGDVFKGLVNKNLLDDVHRHGEIDIFIPGEVFDADKLDGYSADELMGTDQNRLFDVLAFMSVIQDVKSGKTTKSDFDFFTIHPKGLLNEGRYLTNMRCLAFSYMMVMTRGSLPKATGQGADNKLPKLLTDNINMNGKNTERDFAEMLSSTNLDKIKINWMLDISPSQFPEPVKNRILKGTAGSRALKVINQAAILINKDHSLDDKEIELFAKLAELARVSNCYLSLHPLRQSVQAAIPQFYKSCIALAFLAVGENKIQILQAEMRKIQSFTNDQVLNKMSIHNGNITIDGQVFNHSFKGVTPQQLELLFDKPLAP